MKFMESFSIILNSNQKWYKCLNSEENRMLFKRNILTMAKAPVIDSFWKFEWCIKQHYQIKLSFIEDVHTFISKKICGHIHFIKVLSNSPRGRAWALIDEV